VGEPLRVYAQAASFFHHDLLLLSRTLAFGRNRAICLLAGLDCHRQFPACGCGTAAANMQFTADEGMTGMKKTAILATVASGLAVGSASAQDYGDACLMFEHAGFRGEVISMAPDQRVSFRAGQFWNDTVSSVRVARGCTLVIFEHARMQGASAEISRRVHNLGRRWNDRISSAECYCDDFDSY
jgi:hypothetical protein